MKFILIFAFLFASCATDKGVQTRSFKKSSYGTSGGVCYGGFTNCAPHKYSRNW
ncbi:hypothetical protein OAK75_05735 [Bacteriovoracales bacterium]|nr:hypothetical protein [Bacteriovoracales bacterium]